MIDRVSSKMSLIAAQISSFETRTISSTVACTIGNVMRADFADGDAVGKDVDRVERDAAAGGERLIHRVGAERFDADDAHRRPERLDVAADPGNQPAAADRDEDRRDVAEPMPQDFIADGALAGDDQRVVERMDERQSRSTASSWQRACASA